MLQAETKAPKSQNSKRQRLPIRRVQSSEKKAEAYNPTKQDTLLAKASEGHKLRFLGTWLQDCNQETRGPETGSCDRRGIHGDHSSDVVPYPSYQRRQADRDVGEFPLFNEKELRRAISSKQESTGARRNSRGGPKVNRMSMPPNTDEHVQCLPNGRSLQLPMEGRRTHQ